MWEMMLHPFAVAIAWVWVWIHNALVLIGMGSGSGPAWVISIVLLTIVVRALILPLFLKQIKSSRGMQAMQPELKKLTEKYKGKTDAASRQKMAEEQQALYKKHGTNPLASCLPLLVQMPILFAMYRAIFAVKDIAEGTYKYRGEAADSLGAITQEIAKEIDGSTVLGVPLSYRITDGVGTVGIVVFVVLVIAMVAMQFLSMQLSMSRNMPPQADPDNPMVRSQKMMLYMMPAMFIVTGFFFQMGLLIYMITTTTWSWGQSLWTVMYMPTPGSPAYLDLVAKRQKGYQDWARDYFADYDRKRSAIAATDTDAIAALNASALAEVKDRARKQRIASNFPDEMTAGEILTVYRTLSTQDWDTLPDEQWMRAIHRATARSVERREQQAAREQNKRQSRGQRRAKAERQASEQGSSQSGTTDEAQGTGGSKRAHASSSGVELTPEEIERRRQARRKANRAQNKKKKRR